MESSPAPDIEEGLREGARLVLVSNVIQIGLMQNVPMLGKLSIRKCYAAMNGENIVSC